MNASGEVDLDSVNQAYDQNLDNAQEPGAEDESQTQ